MPSIIGIAACRDPCLPSGIVRFFEHNALVRLVHDMPVSQERSHGIDVKVIEGNDLRFFDEEILLPRRVGRSPTLALLSALWLLSKAPTAI